MSDSGLPGYELVGRIGSGGVGEVVLARRLATGEAVAIKALRTAGDRAASWNAARRELEALRRLRGHPNVVRLEDVVVRAGVPYLVMEYASGGSVVDLLDQRGGRLPVGEAVLIATQTAAALSFAHGLPIHHLDVKPQNLLIDRFGQVKVCDFGIAAIVGSHEFRTGVDAATQRYASPEQLDGRTTVGAAADVYMLGATMVALLTGTPGDARRLVDWQVPVELDDDLRQRLHALIAACTAARADSRPTAQTTGDELTAIQRALGALRRVELPAASVGLTPLGAGAPRRAPVSAPDTSSSERPGRRRRRWPWIAIGVGALAATAGIVTTMVVGPCDGRDEREDTSASAEQTDHGDAPLGAATLEQRTARDAAVAEPLVGSWVPVLATYSDVDVDGEPAAERVLAAAQSGSRQWGSLLVSTSTFRVLDPVAVVEVVPRGFTSGEQARAWCATEVGVTACAAMFLTMDAAAAQHLERSG
ncbi:MAG: serine/threonine-protein kinase [Desertimonas sp.]